mmetsp:Transcript_115510/g.331539  ORF Transcript_115510/g.331539 Transcript_115510/m.331539 type:complete len:843 (+) Transcript_115510:1394-3922(+)
MDGVDVIPQPLDRLLVQVIRRLVQQDQVGVLEHGHGQRQAHAPARRQLGNRLLEHVLGETDSQQGLFARIVDADVLGHLDAVLERSEVALAHEPKLRIIDVHTFQVRRHADDAVAGDLFHQRRLAGTVVADDAVTVVLLHLERRVLQQQVAGAVHEQEVFDVQEHLLIRGTGGAQGLVAGLAQCGLHERHGGVREVVHVGGLALGVDDLLEGRGNVRGDLRAGHLLLLALEDTRLGDDIAKAAHVQRLRREDRVRAEDVVGDVTADLPSEAHVGPRHIQLASGDVRGGATDLVVGGRRELELFCRRRLVARRRLDLPGLDKLVVDLSGVLLRPEAQLAGAHFQQLLFDGGHDLLLQLRRPAGVLPSAVGVAFHGCVGIGAHEEDLHEKSLARVLIGAVVRGQKVLAELLVLEHLIHDLAEQHRRLVADGLLAIPLLGRVAVERGAVDGLDAGDEEVGAQVAEARDQRGRRLEAGVLVFLLVARNTHQHGGEQALDERHEVHLHRMRHGLHQLEEASADVRLLVRRTQLDLREDLGGQGLVHFHEHLGEGQSGAKLLADLAVPQFPEQPRRGVLPGVVREDLLHDAERLRGLALHLRHRVCERLLEHRHHNLEVRPHAVRVLDQHRSGTENLGRPLLAHRVALFQAADDDGHEQREGRRIDERQESLVAHLGEDALRVLLVRGLGQGRHELLGQLLDLGTGHHGADFAEHGSGGVADLGPHLQGGLREPGHDEWQARRQLRRGRVGHLLEARGHHLDATGLDLPSLVLHAGQERRHHDRGDAVAPGMHVLHDLAGGLHGRRAELAVGEQRDEFFQARERVGRGRSDGRELLDGRGLGRGRVLA